MLAAQKLIRRDIVFPVSPPSGRNRSTHTHKNTHAQNSSTRSVKTTKTKFEGCVASIGYRDWIVSDIAAEHHVVVLLIVCQTERCLIVMVWRRKKEKKKKSHTNLTNQQRCLVQSQNVNSCFPKAFITFVRKYIHVHGWS